MFVAILIAQVKSLKVLWLAGDWLKFGLYIVGDSAIEFYSKTF